MALTDLTTSNAAPDSPLPKQVAEILFLKSGPSTGSLGRSGILMLSCTSLLGGTMTQLVKVQMYVNVEFLTVLVL